MWRRPVPRVRFAYPGYRTMQLLAFAGSRRAAARLNSATDRRRTWRDQRRERVAGEVFRRRVGAHDVVLDADPAERLERGHAIPVDARAQALVLEFVQQHVDEVQAGLD